MGWFLIGMVVGGWKMSEILYFIFGRFMVEEGDILWEKELVVFLFGYWEGGYKGEKGICGGSWCW